MSRRVAGGVAWTYAGSALVIVAQIAYTAVTTRVLEPAEFGAYACAQALVALMGYFGLAALGHTLTRMTDVPRATVGTALYLATAAGSGAALIALVVADPWASAWRIPDAAHLIALFAPLILLSALGQIPIALLRRRLRYAEAAAIAAVSPIIGFAVGTALVFVLRSPSALVIGQLVSAAALLGLGLVVVRGEVGLRFSKRDARGLLTFSSQVSGQNLLHYVFYALPALVIARLIGSAALGFFSRASLLVMLPMNIVIDGITNSLYPVISQVKDRDARRRGLSDVVAVGTFLVWPLLGVLAGSSSVAVDLLFGAGWDPAAAMIPPLCLFAAGNLVYAILAGATESVGWLNVAWMIQAAWAAALALGTTLAWHFGADARTYLFVYAATQIAVHALQVIVLSNRGLVSLRVVTKHELVGGSMGLVWFAIAFEISQRFEDASLLIRVAAVGVVTIGLAIVTLTVLPRVAAGRALAQRGLLIKALAPRGG